MVCVKAQFRAILTDRAFCSHHEGLSATAAEFVLALATCKMHTTYEKVSFSVFIVNINQKLVFQLRNIFYPELIAYSTDKDI